jgi:hypothetical protein
VCIAGVVTSVARSYAAGQYGNQFGGMWCSGFGAVLTIQAAAVWLAPKLVSRRSARFWAWVAFAAWMLCCCLIILVSYGVALPEQVGSCGSTSVWRFRAHVGRWACAALRRGQPSCSGHAQPDMPGRIPLHKQSLVVGMHHASCFPAACCMNVSRRRGTCACAHSPLPTHMHAHARVRARTHTHIHTHTHTHTRARAHTHARTHAQGRMGSALALPRRNAAGWRHPPAPAAGPRR